jgi:hypothetical protein
MQMKPDDDRLVLDVPEAGAKLGLGRNASYAAAKRGDIPTIKIGRLLRVPIKAFEEKLGIAVGRQDHSEMPR